MSATETRIPLAKARALADWLMRRWRMEPDACNVLGSVRRRKPDVGDLELLAPLPAEQGTDPLYERIAASMGVAVGDGPGLFAGGVEGDDTGAAQAAKVHGRVLEGLKPGFKRCTLVVPGASGAEIQVEIHRYVPGPRGNRGWIELIRTGSEEFSKAVLTEWKRSQCIGPGQDGSRDGFLVRWGPPVAGHDEIDRCPVPTPREMDVFLQVGLLWVEPDQREDTSCLLGVRWTDGRLPQAMRARGLANWDAVMQEWDDMRGKA